MTRRILLWMAQQWVDGHGYYLDRLRWQRILDRAKRES